MTRPCPLLGLVEHPEPAVIRLIHKSERLDLYLVPDFFVHLSEMACFLPREGNLT